MANLNYITPISKFMMQIGELPSSYVLSLTYEEQLIWLYNFLNDTIIAKINEQTDFLNEVQDTMNYILKIISKDEIDRINEHLTMLDGEIANLESTHKQDIQNLNTRINNTISSLTTYIDSNVETLNTKIDNNYSTLNIKIDNNYNELLEMIENLDSFTMINPYTGNVDTVQDVINQIVSNTRNSWNCTQYDGKQLTASTYDNLEITAHDFDFNSKTYVI